MMPSGQLNRGDIECAAVGDRSGATLCCSVIRELDRRGMGLVTAPGRRLAWELGDNTDSGSTGGELYGHLGHAF